MSLPVAFLSAAISAFLCGLAFPPDEWRALAWLGLAPFFASLERRTNREALALGWWWAALFAWSVGEWMPEAIETYYLQSAWVGWAFLLGISTSMVAPYTMLFALVYTRISRREVRLYPIAVGAAWAGAELLRGRLFTGSPFFIGNPWALLGYSQADWTVVVQIASWTGVYGVSFALAAANATLVSLWRARWARNDRRADNRQWIPVAVGLAPAALALGFGALSLRTAARADESAAADPTRIVAIQGNLPLGSRWRSSMYAQNLSAYLELTNTAIAEHAPDVVFWPEGAMTFFVEEEPLYRRAIARVLAGQRVPLVAGGTRAVPDPNGSSESTYRNTIFSLGPTGEIAGRYDKQYLVPFGEYFPLRTIELLRRRFERARVFLPSEGTQLLPVAGLGSVGIATCNEAMLPEAVNERVGLGATLLVNPSNDTWIPVPSFAELQFDIVQLRAVEQRRFLVRASTSGPSAIVDPHGRVVTRTPVDEQAVLVGNVAPRSARSLYSRVGDTFGFSCIAAAAWFARPARRRDAAA